MKDIQDFVAIHNIGFDELYFHPDFKIEEPLNERFEGLLDSISINKSSFDFQYTVKFIFIAMTKTPATRSLKIKDYPREIYKITGSAYDTRYEMFNFILEAYPVRNNKNKQTIVFTKFTAI